MTSKKQDGNNIKTSDNPNPPDKKAEDKTTFDPRDVESAERAAQDILARTWLVPK